MAPPPRVLIVDRSCESRDLLRSLLVRRGVEVMEARGVADGAALAAVRRPDVIVVDSDAARYDANQSAAQLATSTGGKDVPIVVLGTIRRSASPLATAEFVAKPYHYAALVRRIEELVGNPT